MLKPGTILQNRYRIVQPIGQGGMGAVYRAWDMRLRIPVALKEMCSQPGIAPEALNELREQFQQEAAILARLSHPNLVRVTDYFEEGGNAYLVMDYVQGESLADLIYRVGPQPEPLVTRWAKQLLDALAYCHDQNVMHRDIKPQNIIIGADGRAVLVDFGLVKLWDPNDPRTRAVMRGLGTPEYAPPEQYGLSGQHTDPTSDLYSLGATLYHALTGRIPPTATERIARPERFIPLRMLAPHISPQMAYAVMRALELDRSARWRNAREMLYVLEGGTPPPQNKPRSPKVTPASQPTPSLATPKPRPHSSRRRWLWALGLFSGALLLCAALTLILLYLGS